MVLRSIADGLEEYRRWSWGVSPMVLGSIADAPVLVRRGRQCPVLKHRAIIGSPSGTLLLGHLAPEG